MSEDICQLPESSFSGCPISGGYFCEPSCQAVKSWGHTARHKPTLQSVVPAELSLARVSSQAPFVSWVSPALKSSQPRPRYQGDTSCPYWTLSGLFTNRNDEWSRLVLVLYHCVWGGHYIAIGNRMVSPARSPGPGVNQELFEALQNPAEMQSKALFLWDSLPSSKGEVLKGDSLSVVSVFTMQSLPLSPNMGKLWKEPKEGQFCSNQNIFPSVSTNDCPGNFNAHVDDTVKICHQIIQSLWLMLSNTVLLGEEVGNQTNKAKGFSEEFTGGQKHRQRSETSFHPA